MFVRGNIKTELGLPPRTICSKTAEFSAKFFEIGKQKIVQKIYMVPHKE